MVSKVEIIAFSGKIGTGKDYLAQYLHKILQVETPSPTLFVAFADQLKVSVMVEDGVEFSRLFVKKDEESRRLLQLRGTEEGRRTKGEDVWVEYLLSWVKVYASRGISRFFVTDVRFPNEVEGLREFARKEGCRLSFFRIEAPRRSSLKLSEEFGENFQAISAISSHSSEIALDDYVWGPGTYFVRNDPGQGPFTALASWASNYAA